MGIIDKVKGLFGGSGYKCDGNPEKKPLEWFYSEDGKAAYEKCMKYYDEMNEYISECSEDEVYKEIYDACLYGRLKQAPNAQYWPCRYFYWALNAYVVKNSKGKDSIFYKGATIATLMDSTFGSDNPFCYYHLLRMIVDTAVEQEIEWPHSFEAEHNPIFDCLLKKRKMHYRALYGALRDGGLDTYSSETESLKLRTTITVLDYVFKCIINGFDNPLGKESWLFDEKMYIQGSAKKRYSTIGEWIDAAYEKALHPEFLESYKEEWSESNGGNDAEIDLSSFGL